MKKLAEGQKTSRKGAKAQRPVKQGPLRWALRASASLREIVRFFLQLLQLRLAAGAFAGLLFWLYVAPYQHVSEGPEGNSEKKRC